MSRNAPASPQSCIYDSSTRSQAEDNGIVMSGALPVPSESHNSSTTEETISKQIRKPKKVTFVGIPSPASSDDQGSKRKRQSFLERAGRAIQRKSSEKIQKSSRNPRETMRARAAGNVLSQLQSPPATPPHVNKIWTEEDEQVTRSNVELLTHLTHEISPERQQKRKRHSSQISTTANKSNDSKRAKLTAINNERFVLPQKSLSELQPQPIRIDYPLHPAKDRNDEWFITEFRQLYKMLDAFAETHFGVHDLETDESFRPWRLDLGQEFISWAEQIVEDGGIERGWDELLMNTMQRRWLVMGIVMRVLMKNVFDEDLFGADEEEKKLLLAIERSLLTREGFQRTLLRSQTVTTILSDHSTTRHFYPCVARLTAQIALLLNPLSTYLYSIPPSTPSPLPNHQDQYQALHNILSTAAYLSLCIRVSPTIIQFVDVTAGDTYDHEDQHNLDPPGYWAGVDSTKEAHASVIKTWRKTHYKPALKALKSAEKGTEAEELAMKKMLEVQKTRPLGPDYLRRPMVRMSVWPVVTRYTAGGGEDDEREARGEVVVLGDKDGFRVRQICKAGVVLWFGERERKERGLLREYVKMERARSVMPTATIVGALAKLGTFLTVFIADGGMHKLLGWTTGEETL